MSAHKWNANRVCERCGAPQEIVFDGKLPKDCIYPQNVVSLDAARMDKLNAETVAIVQLAKELGIKTGDKRATMTDTALAGLLGFESVREMIECSAGKSGKIWIDTCDGQWIKYQQSTTWIFNREPGE